MSEINLDVPDLSKEILSVGSASDSPASVEHKPVDVPAVQPVPKLTFRVGKKVYKDHRKLLDQGVHPRDIRHISYGVWKGCQCLDCKTKRNEMDATPLDGSTGDPMASPANAPALSELFTEKFCGKILNLPNEFARLFLKARKAPKEAIDVWDIPEEDVRIYGQFGKHLADTYLNLPDFKHKELITFGAWYLSQLGMRMAAMKAILAQMEPPKEPTA